MSGRLSVHIIGCGLGESIILALPNGKVGVIDCFSPSLKATNSGQRLKENPTLRYLRNVLKADRLAFLAFTHPHEDRGRGLSHLLIEYKDRIDEIWIFDAFQDIGLERFFSAVLYSKRKLPIEKLLNEEPGTFSVELLTIRKLVLEQIRLENPHRAIPRVFCGCATVQVAGEPVAVQFLGPSVALAQEYKAHLIDNLEGLVDADGCVLNPSWKHDSINHNLASPAFLVEYGKTRIVLGADMEGEGWSEVLRDAEESNVPLQCHFVKVSHHGSATGYTDDLYEKFCQSGQPLAALTPFNRHKYPLPQHKGVGHLLQNCSELWVTSLEDAQRSLGIESPLSVDELMRVAPRLERWRRTLNSFPQYWTALDPGFVEQMGQPVPGQVANAIPGEWLPDLSEEPRLATLIHPRLRQSYLPRFEKRVPIEDEYRLCFSFDDKGSEIGAERHIGGGCGRLA